MRAYLMDLRERVLRDSDAGLTAAAVAVKYHVSASWVRRLKQRRREGARCYRLLVSCSIVSPSESCEPFDRIFRGPLFVLVRRGRCRPTSQELRWHHLRGFDYHKSITFNYTGCRYSQRIPTLSLPAARAYCA